MTSAWRLSTWLQSAGYGRETCALFLDPPWSPWRGENSCYSLSTAEQRPDLPWVETEFYLKVLEATVLLLKRLGNRRQIIIRNPGFLISAGGETPREEVVDPRTLVTERKKWNKKMSSGFWHCPCPSFVSGAAPLFPGVLRTLWSDPHPPLCASMEPEGRYARSPECWCQKVWVQSLRL